MPLVFSTLPEPVASRLDLLIRQGGSQAAHALWVPGRIELLGKHTDYAGGDSLTCASQHGMAALVYGHPEPSLIIDDAARGERIVLPFDAPDAETSWARYPSVALKRVMRHFGKPSTGIHILLHSDLPSASGMSSSSVLIVTVVLALLGEGGYAHLPFESREDLAGFAGAVESGADWKELPGDEGVGTRGGSQDHTAILCSQEGMLSLFGYQPIRCHERVRLPESVALVVAGSGVKARKTGEAKSAYNRVSWRAAEVARQYSQDLGEHYPHLGAMMAAPHFDLESLRWAITDDDLWERFQQFEREIDYVVPSALRALKKEDWSLFATVTAESQRMASQWLHNQIPETEALVGGALAAGALAASSFGAGFGGAVWALVERSKRSAFSRAWQAAYAVAFPEQSDSMIPLNEEPGIPAWTSPHGLLHSMPV